MMRWRIEKVTLAVLMLTLVTGVSAAAVDSSSSNYQVSETQFGSSSNEEGCSDQYCARVSMGEFASGESRGATSTAAFGTIAADSEPLLEVIVEEGESNLGELSTERTASKTTQIKIRSYLSDGYTLQLTGEPPRIDGHQLATPTEPTAAIAGSEQFAINVVANTTPAVGSDPAQDPDATLSFGQPEPNYGTSNLFMYQSDDVIARSTTESGQTDYTVSMIVNISNATPAGHYASDFSAIVVPVF